MRTHRLLATLAFILVMPIGLGTAASAQKSYVANTAPPDAFLALKAYPSGNSPRIMAMANGTKLDVLLRERNGAN